MQSCLADIIIWMPFLQDTIGLRSFAAGGKLLQVIRNYTWSIVLELPLECLKVLLVNVRFFVHYQFECRGEAFSCQ